MIVKCGLPKSIGINNENCYFFVKNNTDDKYSFYTCLDLFKALLVGICIISVWTSLEDKHLNYCLINNMVLFISINVIA